MSPVSFQILLALKDEPRDAEGVVSRMRELGAASEPPLASFYRALKRALDAGHLQIVETAASASDEGRRGRPRQSYRITRSGRAALETEARRLGKLAKLALG
ncbi:MAG: PadR family transcriptional regulator [Vicinamibacteria bacterium]